jgi:hypothetical protein
VTIPPTRMSSAPAMTPVVGVWSRWSKAQRLYSDSRPIRQRP